jgi:hypothetical protein
MQVGEYASCVEPAPASDDAACAAIVQAADQQICLADCDRDADCGEGSRCVAGACWGDPPGVVDKRDGGGGSGGANAGVGGGGTAGSTGPLPPPRLPGIDAGIDLSTVDAAVRFDVPIDGPAPETAIATTEPASALAGVWEAAPGSTEFWGGPVRLEITAGAAGLTGTIAFMCAPGVCDPEGPPPPATDPDDGYPPGLDPIEQDHLRSAILPRTPYRMLDARLTGVRLTFWFTNNDLWRDWCALQTPHPVVVNGRSEFGCTPDPQPCDSFIGRDPAEIVGDEMLCCAETALCRCDASGCRINYQSSAQIADLVVEGDVMEGVLLYGDTLRLVLQRSTAGQP